MTRRLPNQGKLTLLAGMLSVSISAFAGLGPSIQDPAGSAVGLPAGTSPATSSGSKASVSRSQASVMSARGTSFYRLRWGIDDIAVREVSSGWLVRFSFRVVDPDKAKVLNNTESTPYMIDERTGAALQIPSLEQVGQLRQSSTPEKGTEYWMVFSNSGKYIHPGSRVDIVIGNFRINGLIVR